MRVFIFVTRMPLTRRLGIRQPSRMSLIFPITLINPTVGKGVNTVAAVAALLPQSRYLVVPGGYGRAKLDAFDEAISYGADVVIHPAQLDPCSMDEIYSETSVLMMPSHNEAWGSVGLEALAHGVPVVASGLPGIIEALGDSATYAGPLNFGAMAELVEKALDVVYAPEPSNAYADFVTNSRAHVVAQVTANRLQRQQLVGRITSIAGRARLSAPADAFQ